MNDELKSFLDEKAVFLEKKRKKALRLNYIYKIVKPIRSILNAAFIILCFVNIIAPILIPLLLIVGAVLLLLSIMNDPKEVYESKLKTHVLPEIFKHVNATFSYHSSGYNPHTLQESELLSKGFFKRTVKIRGEDYVLGKIKNIDVEFFEIEFYKEVVNVLKTAGGCLFLLIMIPIELFKNVFHGDMQSDEIYLGISKDIKVFYSGFFMYADFHKDFTGKVLMIPKKNERIRHKVNELLEPKNLTKINVENPFIDSNYNIYSSDAQLGYYVLSQSLIDKIHIMSDKENALPIISFIHGKMYFIIPWNKNYFTTNIKAKVENGDYFLSYIEEVESFEAIIKDLNLDTRIWTKV